jgi:hypothetical protein
MSHSSVAVPETLLRADPSNKSFSGDLCNGDPGGILDISFKGFCIPTDSPARHSFYISDDCSIVNVEIHVRPRSIIVAFHAVADI